jgi:hypothetical protein
MRKNFKNYSKAQQDCSCVSPPEDCGVQVSGVWQQLEDELTGNDENGIGKENGKQFGQAAPQHDKCNGRLEDDRDKPQD